MREADETVRADAPKRSALVRQIRAQARDLLAQRHAERQLMSKRIRMSLRVSRADVVASVGRIRYSQRLMLEAGKVRGIAARPERVFGLHSLPKEAGHAVLDNRKEVHGSGPRPTLEEQVILIVGKHPHGLTVNEIGNEMGVDWRELLETADRLAQDGRIEQIAELFYPTGNGFQQENYGH